MSLYSTVVFLHVLTAILGLGPLTVLALAASGPSRTAFPLERFARVLRLVGWSLAGMFVTGAGIIAFTHGALGETGWMRASFALFVFLGFLHGMARRQIRIARKAGSATAPGPALGRLLWSMCIVVGAITYLMEAKP